jgi:hypothetical protein
MKSEGDREKAPQSKPSVKEQPQDRLTEDGPNEMPGKKTSPFRKLLNNLWGPIRG